MTESETVFALILLVVFVVVAFLTKHVALSLMDRKAEIEKEIIRLHRDISQGLD